MDGIGFIQDLAIVLLGAGIAGALCKRIGLSVIVGYLLAGMIIGPYTPPFSLVLDLGRIETLSQVGLIFLMFAIGLGLSLTKLRRMGFPTLLATGLGAFFVLNLTQLLGKAVGWTPAQSLFVAAMFMVSSSAVIAKVIKEMNLGHERSGQMALAITVLEDVVAVVMLAILGSRSAAGADLGSLLTGLVAFVVLLVIAALLFVPRLLRRLGTEADTELQTIVVAGVLFLAALMAVKSGYSLALGAFLLGAVIAELPHKSGIEKSFAGARDMFSSVFFVAIGMLIDVSLLFAVWPWILALTLFVLFARPLSTGLALILVGTPPHDARRGALALIPLGEFTFVIVQLGVASQVLAANFYAIAVGTSILTVLLTPVINRHAEPILQRIEKAEPRWLNRALEVYHQWLAQLGNLPQGSIWRQMSRKRLVQVVLEVLFVTGLLAFSLRLLSAVEHSAVAGIFTPTTLRLLFWSVFVLLVSVPLLAIWRNLSTVAMIYAEVAAKRNRLLGPIVENGFKTFSVLAIAYWFLRLLPADPLPWWAWLGIAALLAVVVAVFSRRLIFLHSEWEISLRDMFSENKSVDSPRQRPWMKNSSDWGINVQEFIVPERAECSGRRIADLQVRSQYGCSIVEINRQGYTIVAPEPTEALYSGDRLLLLGTRPQIAAARLGLGKAKSAEESAAFDSAHLETLSVPPGPQAGLSLADLQITQRTGVLVAGIDRAGKKIVNPGGDERLAVGDELLILGSPEQIRHFRDWLTSDPGKPGAVPLS